MGTEPIDVVFSTIFTGTRSVIQLSLLEIAMQTGFLTLLVSCIQNSPHCFPYFLLHRPERHHEVSASIHMLTPVY